MGKVFLGFSKYPIDDNGLLLCSEPANQLSQPFNQFDFLALTWVISFSLCDHTLLGEVDE